MSSSIPSLQILTAHAQPFSGVRDLAFCLKVPLDSQLVWASSEDSGETARMRRLAWTFAARIGYKYQIRLTRSKLFRHLCSLWISSRNFRRLLLVLLLGFAKSAVFSILQFRGVPLRWVSHRRGRSASSERSSDNLNMKICTYPFSFVHIEWIILSPQNLWGLRFTKLSILSPFLIKSSQNGIFLTHMIKISSKHV